MSLLIPVLQHSILFSSRYSFRIISKIYSNLKFKKVLKDTYCMKLQKHLFIDTKKVVNPTLYLSLFLSQFDCAKCAFDLTRQIHDLFDSDDTCCCCGRQQICIDCIKQALNQTTE